MKRTNLIVNEDLLKEAKRLLNAESFSAAVNSALAQAIQLVKIRGLEDLFGSGIWQGNLGEMREDTKKHPKSKRRAK